MSSGRPKIPKSTREQVLKEYNHLCAVCGRHSPQLHHIDGNPSNNDLMNLIPLCPNNHLIDAHNPTQPIEPKKLKLLRKFKDPTVLTPQFHPLFIRVRFLDEIKDDTDEDELGEKVSELFQFVEELEMGNFYANRIYKLLARPKYVRIASIGGPLNPQQEIRERETREQRSREYREKLRNVCDEVYSLVVELLRFQHWRLEMQNIVDQREVK